MALYAHITESCREDARSHGLLQRIETIRNEVEKNQNLTGFDFFPPTPFLKKSLGRSFRLIAFRAPIQEHDLILFLRVLPKGHTEYREFLRRWAHDTDGLVRSLNPYGPEQLEKIMRTLIEKPLPGPPPPLSDEERKWLYKVFRAEIFHNDLFILETEHWVRKMKDPHNQTRLALYQQVLERLNLDQLEPADDNSQWSRHSCSNTRMELVYLYRPDLQKLLLFDIVRGGENLDDALREAQSLLSKIGDAGEDLSRIAARSYPFYMVLDQDAWLAIQKDEAANLALSPEEAGILASIKRAGVRGELGYPLFVNGRAGSGKSTILQYLAADYVDFACRNPMQHVPLYLTCSPDLLGQARDTVRSILNTHHTRLLEGVGETSRTRRLEEILERTFVVFRDFLFFLLPGERQEELRQGRLIRYDDFRRLWTETLARNPGARRLSPELCWHAIRTYVKGMRSSREDELTPEEFDALPQRHRSLSSSVYADIYENVWSKWYKPLCMERRLWDDQDLAALVLDSGVLRNVEYAAVFCDEAQDFTSAELEILFQLSLFSRRSMNPEELPRVPIVFAGDPLQTINPTGFRWEAVRADFHDRLKAVLDPRRRSPVEMAYRELRFNYRSNPGIVRFCNLIQLARAAILGDLDLQPQEAWWVDTPRAPVWFTLDGDSSPAAEKLSQAPDLVKVVNCEEGAETAYVENDSVLSSVLDNTEGVYRNVLSTTRSKGLEFSGVVVYRFGETAPSNFGSVLDSILDGCKKLDNPEERLPYEYFFNRLYVAASRAKGQLMVIDTPESMQAFWRFATDPDMLERLLRRVKKPEMWKTAVLQMGKGGDSSWAARSGDPTEQAEEYAGEGRRKRDPFLLRQAALAYRSVLKEHEAKKCLAQAAEYEGNLLHAGDKYRDLGLLEDAFRCYWTGRHWRPLCVLTSTESALAGRLESRAADFMDRPAALESFIPAFITALSDPDWLKGVAADATWCHVFAETAKRLSRAFGRVKLNWLSVHKAYGAAARNGMSVDSAFLALIAYAAEQYDEAVRLWEQGGIDRPHEYNLAKAHITPFPGNLHWLSQAKQHDEVIAQYREHGPVAATDDKAVRAVMRAAFEVKDWVLAARMLALRPDSKELSKLLKSVRDEKDPEVLGPALAAAARFVVRNRYWDAVPRVVDEGDFSRIPDIDPKDFETQKTNPSTKAAVMKAVVEELALSEDLASENSERKAPVTNFLHQHFIAGGEATAETYGISPRILGAAIERSGKIIDALQYYGTLQRRSASPELRRFAAERLVCNLERYAEYFRKRGDESWAQERAARAAQIREQTGIGSQVLSDYPAVHAEMESPPPGEWRHGPLRMVVSKPHGRMRIEHLERFESVTLDWEANRLLGDASFSPVEPPTPSYPSAWWVEGWNARIELSSGDTAHCVIALEGLSPLTVPLS